MRRIDLIAAGAVVLAASPARANDDSTGGAALNIAGVGLPVIAGGRIRNYVFVTIRLHLGAGQTAETMRPKDPFFRDAIVRAAHRTPFTLAEDWTQLNAQAISATLMRVAPGIAGRGAVTRAEVLIQAPRRRTGVRAG